MVRPHGSWVLGLWVALVACSASNDDGGTRAGGSSATSGSTNTGTSTGQAGSHGAAGSGSSNGGAGGGAATSGTAGSSNAGAGGNTITGAGGNGTGIGGSSGATDGGGAGGSAGAGGTIRTGDSGAGDSSTDASGTLPPLTPCTDPSVSRLKVWEMQVVGGTMVPANGSPLRRVGDAYELHVVFTLQGAGPYGTANAPLNNQGEFTNGANPAENAVDISSAAGITLEYATTGAAYLQIRTATVPHGGDHFRADMPVTGDQVRTITLYFADFRRPGGTTPPGADILRDVFSFTFVASATNTMTLRQVRVAGFTPPCN